jgi:hypothetical protein
MSRRDAIGSCRSQNYLSLYRVPDHKFVVNKSCCHSKEVSPMSFLQILLGSIKGMFPGFLIWAVFPMIPFIIAEQRWPAVRLPACATTA